MNTSKELEMTYKEKLVQLNDDLDVACTRVKAAKKAVEKIRQKRDALKASQLPFHVGDEIAYQGRRYIITEFVFWTFTSEIEGELYGKRIKKNGKPSKQEHYVANISDVITYGKIIQC